MSKPKKGIYRGILGLSVDPQLKSDLKEISGITPVSRVVEPVLEQFVRDVKSGRHKISGMVAPFQGDSNQGPTTVVEEATTPQN